MPKNRLKGSKPNPQRASLEFEVIAPITSTELESFAMEKILCKEFTAIPYLPSFCSECVLTLHKKHPTGPRPRNPKEGSFERCESGPHGCPFSKLGPVDRKQVRPTRPLSPKNVQLATEGKVLQFRAAAEPTSEP